MYSGCSSGRQNPFRTIFLLLLRLWGCGQGAERLVHHIHRRLAETEVSPFDDVILEYVNPATGKSLYPTFTCCVQMIRPGVRTRAHRHTSCAVYYVFQGEGHSVVGDRRFDWAEGDLFSIHDFPAMKSLGIYHEMPHPDGHLAQA